MGLGSILVASHVAHERMCGWYEQEEIQTKMAGGFLPGSNFDKWLHYNHLRKRFGFTPYANRHHDSRGFIATKFIF
jgi:hypothetical protein